VLGTASVSDGTGVADVSIETSGEHMLRAHFVPDDPQEFTESASAELVLEVGSAPALDPVIDLSATEGAAGAELTVTGSGFGAGAGVGIELHSDPVSLGEATTGKAGAFSTSVTIPADTAPGEHEVVVTGSGSGAMASAAVTILA